MKLNLGISSWLNLLFKSGGDLVVNSTSVGQGSSSEAFLFGDTAKVVCLEQKIA